MSCFFACQRLKLRAFSRILFPDVIVGGHINNCTSSGCNLVNISLSTENLDRPRSSSVNSNWWSQFDTVPQILSWFTKWNVWKKNSMLIECPLKCMVLFHLSYFKIPCFNALLRWRRGCQDSLNRCTISSAAESQFFFLIVTKNSHITSFPIPDPRMSNDFAKLSSRNSGLSRNSKYNSHHFFPLNVIEHWHEVDSVLELFGMDWMFSLSKSFWISWKNRQWWKSREKFPLEFNCLSIDSHFI